MTEQIARIYDARATIPYDPTSDSAFIADDVMLVEEVTGTCDRLLDAGCGLGWHIDRFVDRGFPCVVGVDLSCASIKAARARLTARGGTGWHLLCEDLREHRPSVNYSAAASFLSCVGSFGESGDLVLLRSLRRQLRSGAFLVMTSFYIEGVDALLGEFTTKYASDSTVTLHTRSSFDVQRREVVFNQRIEGEALDSMHEIEEERIRLYTANEMRALLAGAGFSRVETFPECKLHGMRRSVDRSGVMLSLASA